MLFMDPWIEEHSETFLKELHKEVSINHVLYATSLRVIARRMDRDDVLFKYENTSEVVQVHLTWKKNIEDDPNWPRTKVFASIHDCMDQVMIHDSKEFN